MDFSKDLNPAQLEAATSLDGPLLVIAGAGSGKTRTIVYRLAHLVSGGVTPSSILLLTFTRKAAAEMLGRASRLLGGGLESVSGGTFHAFAYATLRRHAAALGYSGGLSIMDRPDAEDIIGKVRDELELGKGDKSFPKRSTIAELISKSRNKERELPDILSEEAYHLLMHAPSLSAIGQGYERFKNEHGLLDYDDLLFSLERLLRTRPDILDFMRLKHRYILVDEYQDTNLVQARLAKLLAGESGNIMAVGDDAQSIYGFRGASVGNILSFPNDFPGTKIVRLEQNYRSTQPILDLTNAILRGLGTRFDKTLYSERTSGPKPELFLTYSEQTQAGSVLSRLRELLKRYPPYEVAVLFRSGFQSFALEIALNKAQIPFRKHGGIKFSEAAHVKDALSFLRVSHNPLDFPSWLRLLSLVGGVGPKTALRIFEAVRAGDAEFLAAKSKKLRELGDILEFLKLLAERLQSPAEMVELALGFYAPILMRKYPDDYPARQNGLEQLVQIASGYKNLEDFLSDLTLDSPDNEEEAAEAITLSTVHSAKGLEWAAVLLIDLVDERFPSRHALQKQDQLEEERRLLYVACTRARDYLGLYSPERVFNRQGGYLSEAKPSLFLRELPGELYTYWRESCGRTAPPLGTCESPPPQAKSPASPGAGVKLGRCSHKIFGQGKILADLGEGKLRVNFQGFGPKVILANYLTMLD